METAFRYISIIALSALDMSYLWQRSVDVEDLRSRANLGCFTRSTLRCHVLCGAGRRFGEQCVLQSEHLSFFYRKVHSPDSHCVAL
jgi:hypothetical protein